MCQKGLQSKCVQIADAISSHLHGAYKLDEPVKVWGISWFILVLISFSDGLRNKRTEWVTTVKPGCAVTTVSNTVL